jgi:hypothetical protein
LGAFQTAKLRIAIILTLTAREATGISAHGIFNFAQRRIVLIYCVVTLLGTCKGWRQKEQEKDDSQQKHGFLEATYNGLSNQ